MLKVGWFDDESKHLHNYCGYDISSDMDWTKDSYDPDILVYTERCYNRVKDPRAKGKINCAMPSEPRVIHPYGYDIDMDKFDFILTHDRILFEKAGAKAKFWSPGGSWIWLRDWAIYPKIKNVSIVAGMKDWATGHRLRQEAIKALSGKFDLVCGYGRNPIEHKVDIFKDFRYSVVIENSKVDWYWTDKLIDCMACGCVPIFWGCPDIGRYFNLDGIITFDNISELEEKIKLISEDDYNRRLPAIKDNFERARAFVPVEKYMYNNIFKDLK